MVSIKILNAVTDPNSSEYAASVFLKDMLKESIPDTVSGNISIAYGLTLSGQEIRDIDILIVGQLDNYTIPDYYTNNAQYAKKPLTVDSFWATKRRHRTKRKTTLFTIKLYFQFVRIQAHSD